MQPYFILVITILTLPFFSHAQQNSLKDLPENQSTVDELNNSAKDTAKEAPNIALALAWRANEIATDLEYTDGEAKSLTRLGMAFQSKGENDSALKYYTRSLDFRQKNNMPSGGIASTHTRLGDVYENQGMYTRALVHRREVVKIRKRGDNTKYKAIAYRNIGFTFQLISERKQRTNTDARVEIDSALYYYKAAMELSKNGEDASVYARNCNQLSSMYRIKLDYDSALIYLNKAESILQKEQSSSYELLDTYIRKGRIYDFRKEYDLGFDYHDKALDLSVELKDTLQQLFALNNLGENKFLQKDYRNALGFYLRSLEVSKYCQEESTYLKILYTNLSNVYDALNNPKEALKYNRESAKLGSKISLSQEKAQIRDAEANEKMKASIIQTQRDQEQFRQSIYLLGTLIFVIFLSGLWYLNYRRRYQKLLLIKREGELLSELKDTEQDLLFKQNETQGKALMTVSRELHDDVGATLVAAQREMEGFEGTISKLIPQSKNKYDNILSLVNKAYQDLRNVSHNLHKNSLNKSLSSSLKELVKTIQDQEKNLNISLHIENPGSISLSSKIELFSYRIVQEALTNIIKYAKAQKVELQVLLANNYLSITIEDDGVGFDSEEKKDGIGLQNMKSRAEELNGILTIDSAKGRGTSLFVEIPVIIQSNN